MFPNFEEATVCGEKLSETFDTAYFEKNVIPKVQSRGYDIFKLRKGT